MGEVYGNFSDFCTAEGLLEIIQPRTQELGDYTNVVSRLIENFAGVADVDELTLYCDLVTTERAGVALFCCQD